MPYDSLVDTGFVKGLLSQVMNSGTETALDRLYATLPGDSGDSFNSSIG